MYKYWTEDDYKAVEKAQTYAELFSIAKKILERMPHPRAQLCGPISTGGAGSIEKNLWRFDIAIDRLQKEGVEVFSQMPLEEGIRRIREKEGETIYPMSLLEDLYLPIFENKLVDKVYFLPDWQSSKGASWEHEQTKRLGIEIIYLDID